MFWFQSGCIENINYPVYGNTQTTRTVINITFGLSIFLSLFIGLTGGHESRFIIIGFSTMAIPAMAVLFMRYFFMCR